MDAKVILLGRRGEREGVVLKGHQVGHGERHIHAAAIVQSELLHAQFNHITRMHNRLDITISADQGSWLWVTALEGRWFSGPFGRSG